MNCKKKDCKKCKWFIKEENYCKRYFKYINIIIFKN